MIRYLYILICLFAWHISVGQGENFKEANNLYEAGDYVAAIDKYGSVVAEGYQAAALYYNLGNAHYRNGELGKAIWAYESALKIEPSHQDALHNLTFVNAQTADKIDTQRHGFGFWLQGIMFSSHINFWTYISIACSIVFTLLAFLFIGAKNKRKRSLILMATYLFGLSLMISIGMAYLHKQHITTRGSAIVITQQVDVLLSPTENGKASYKISEGAKVELISEEKEWVKININGNEGWLLKKDIWEI